MQSGLKKSELRLMPFADDVYSHYEESGIVTFLLKSRIVVDVRRRL